MEAEWSALPQAFGSTQHRQRKAQHQQPQEQAQAAAVYGGVPQASAQQAAGSRASWGRWGREGQGHGRGRGRGRGRGGRGGGGGDALRGRGGGQQPSVDDFVLDCFVQDPWEPVMRFLERQEQGQARDTALAAQEIDIDDDDDDVMPLEDNHNEIDLDDEDQDDEPPTKEQQQRQEEAAEECIQNKDTADAGGPSKKPRLSAP